MSKIGNCKYMPINVHINSESLANIIAMAELSKIKGVTITVDSSLNPSIKVRVLTIILSIIMIVLHHMDNSNFNQKIIQNLYGLLLSKSRIYSWYGFDTQNMITSGVISSSSYLFSLFLLSSLSLMTFFYVLFKSIRIYALPSYASTTAPSSHHPPHDPSKNHHIMLSLSLTQQLIFTKRSQWTSFIIIHISDHSHHMPSSWW